MFELFLFRGLPADVTERFHRHANVRQKPFPALPAACARTGRPLRCAAN
jgi:hypothetical protein